MAKQIGFLKLYQEFRNDSSCKKEYLSILDKLSEIALKHKNTLPYSFEVEDFPFDVKDLEEVLRKLYPNRRYSCHKTDQRVICVRS